MMSTQIPFITFVDRILAITNPPTSPFAKGGQKGDYLQNPQKQAQVKALEREIDVMVYMLYNLAYDEVKIVDPEFRMTQEEYEAMYYKKMVK